MVDLPLRNSLVLLYRETCHLAFPLTGAGAGSCTALATSYIYPRDLDARGLITLLSCYDVDIVQRGQLP
jgi:hypothetical protein